MTISIWKRTDKKYYTDNNIWVYLTLLKAYYIGKDKYLCHAKDITLMYVLVYH